MLELEPIAAGESYGFNGWHIVAFLGILLLVWILLWPIRRWTRSLRRREM